MILRRRERIAFFQSESEREVCVTALMCSLITKHIGSFLQKPLKVIKEEEEEEGYNSRNDGATDKKEEGNVVCGRG